MPNDQPLFQMRRCIFKKKMTTFPNSRHPLGAQHSPTDQSQCCVHLAQNSLDLDVAESKRKAHFDTFCDL